MKKHFKFMALVGFGLSLSTLSVQAQTSDCTIDVQPIVAKLIDAQAAAAADQQDEALGLIAEAKSDLSALETACTAELVSAPELTTTFEAPDESFTFNYPDGWLADTFTLTLESFGTGGRAIVGSSERALKSLQQSVDALKLEPTDQAAMVIVGTPNTVLYGLGIYDESASLKDDSSLTALTDMIQSAVKDGQVFDTITEPIYDGNTVRFTIGNKEFDGIVLLKQMSGTKFGFTLVVGDTETLPAVTALGEAIEASIQ